MRRKRSHPRRKRINLVRLYSHIDRDKLWFDFLFLEAYSFAPENIDSYNFLRRRSKTMRRKAKTASWKWESGRGKGGTSEDHRQNDSVPIPFQYFQTRGRRGGDRSGRRLRKRSAWRLRLLDVCRGNGRGGVRSGFIIAWVIALNILSFPINTEQLSGKRLILKKISIEILKGDQNQSKWRGSERSNRLLWSLSWTPPDGWYFSPLTPHGMHCQSKRMIEC